MASFWEPTLIVLALTLIVLRSNEERQRPERGLQFPGRSA
jgi:hypothetical protein